jgi:predicted nuclease of predicted toxin-antitoxin system
VRWLGDECVEAGLVARLRAESHDVLYVADALAGATDAEIIEGGAANQRLLLTVDKDFGDLVFRRARRVPGVVLLR